MSRVYSTKEVNMDWKYSYVVDQIHRTAYKKHESYVIGSLLHDTNLSEIKPCTQYYVKRKDGGYALLDLFYPQINLAVEIDEPHHENHRSHDGLRQEVVEQDLQCGFIRIEVSKGNVPDQIATLKAAIQLKAKRTKNAGLWEGWIEPHILSIVQAKNQFRKTLFLKIRGEIPPNELMARQTGYWRIAKTKQERISQVVVIHNLIVTRVFKNIAWHTCKENPHKVGYSGEEVESEKSVGTIIENWKSQQTVTYSNDLY